MKPDEDGQFSASSSVVRTQHGALCWRIHADSLQVLLISSRDTGRWIIPKGWPIPGLSPQDTALREAWEEAGVRGKVDPLSLGQYPYFKVLGPGLSVPCLVTVYAVKVSRLQDRFPERKERHRKWFPLVKALARVEEPDLAALLAAFSPKDPAPSSG